MSNVLVGIIGVILFIGLALAGALILGDDFRSASHDSKAAATASLLQQASSAISMYQLKTGAVLPSSAASNYARTIGTRFIRTNPANPVNGTPLVAVNAGGGHDGNATSFVYTGLGTDDAARAVCVAIEAMAGNPDPDEAMAPVRFGTRASANRRLGCLRNESYSPGVYQAYVPV